MQNGFVFTSQESLVSPHRLRVSPGQWCQPCPPHSPLGAVFVLHDDTFELDKAICVFHFAAFCFNVFTACFFFFFLIIFIFKKFILVGLYAILNASDCINSSKLSPVFF